MIAGAMTKGAVNPKAIKRFRVGFLVIALALLSIPLIAMQFSNDEVDWSVFDFVFGAAMFAALGTAIELAIRFAPGRMLRAGAIALLIAGFVFVWAGLATA